MYITINLKNKNKNITKEKDKSMSERAWLYNYDSDYRKRIISWWRVWKIISKDEEKVNKSSHNKKKQFLAALNTT